MCRIACIVACCVLSWAVWAESFVAGVTSVPKPEVILTHPTANLVYVGSSGNPPRLRYLDAASGVIKQPEITLASPTNAIRAMAVDPINNKLYVATTSSIVFVYNATDPSVSPTTITLSATNEVNNIYCMVVDPVHNLLFLGGTDANKEFVRVDLNGTPTPAIFDANTQIYKMAVDPLIGAGAGKVFVAADSSTALGIFDIAGGQFQNAGTPYTAPETITSLTAAAGRGAYFGGLAGAVYQIAGNGTFPRSTTPDANPRNIIALSPTSPPKIYVGSTSGDSVYAITDNGSSFAVSSKITVESPRSIAVSAATGRAYVTFNQSSLGFIRPNDTLSKIDDNSSGSQIGTVVFNPTTNRLFAIDQAAGFTKVYVYDAAVMESINAPMLNGLQTGVVAVNTIDGNFYAASNNPMGGNAIYQIKSDGTRVDNTFGGASGVAADIAINEITNKIYVSNPSGNTVSVLQGGSNFSMPAIAIPIDDTNLPPQLRGTQPSAIAINPALNRIYVANKQSNNVTVIYGGNDKVIATIPVGTAPEAIVVDSNTNRVYVANKGSNNITIVDGEQNLLVATVTAGPSPQGLALGNNNRLYVSSFSSSDVSVIDLSLNTMTGGLTTGNSNNMIAFNRANSRVYVVSRGSSGDLTIFNSSNNSALTAPNSVGTSPVGLVCDSVTNRVFVQQSNGSVTVIDGGYVGDTFQEITTGGDALGIAFSPLTRKLIVTGNTTRLLDVESSLVSDPPVLASTGLLANNRLSSSTTAAFTFTGDANGSIYYQLDSVSGAWTRVLATGALQTITLNGLAPGRHTIFVFKANNQEFTASSQGSGIGVVENNAAAISKVEGFVFYVKPATFPTLDAIGAQSVKEDQGLVEIEFFGATPGPLGNAIVVTTSNANSNPPTLLGTITATLNNDGTGRGKVSFTPNLNEFGSINITVNITDNSAPAGLRTVSRTFPLLVRPVNDAPAFNVGANITVTEAAVVSTTPGFISGVVLGPTNETTGMSVQAISQYIVTAASPDQFKVQPAISLAGVLTFTPANNTSIASPITISVQLMDNGGTTDGGSDTSTVRTFTITLTPVADSLVVTNTSDNATANSNSLRDCMTRARAGDTITFDSNIFDLTNSNAATVINVTGGGLPTLNDGNVTIEASDRRVTINGSGTVDASGILVASSNNTIRGLSIVGFPGPGLRIQGGASNIIGGSRTSGTGPNGQGLRIAGNGSFGFEIRGTTATANLVKGCWIGLDAAGTSAEANLAGILIQDGANGNTIGGAGSGEANVIGGNKFEGTTFSGTGTDGNVFVGNEVGIAAVASTTSSGAVSRDLDSLISVRSSVGNGSAGLFLSRGTNGSRVGGDSDTDSNVVANNGGNGVEVRAAGSRRNASKKNRISKNKSGGIALFDNANDGITAPTFTSVTKLSTTTGTASRAAVRVAIAGTASTTTGTVEIFNDSGSQGETFVTRSTVSAGTWTTEVDVSDVLNITATLTDDNGNTSAFSVFGRSPGDDSGVDTDGDGISDALETLAGTDPNSATSLPTSGGALIVDKAQISLNFAKADKDSLKSTIRLVLPTGYINTGAVVAVQFADSSESVTLTDKGSGPKGLVTLKLTGGSTTAAPANTGAKITYSITKKTLLSALQSAGLDNETTDKVGETLTIPVGIAITSGTTKTVYTGTVTVIYKATTGKTGKAKQSL